MKREIEWVDVFFSVGSSPTLPSEVLALVHDVRTEALDSFELELRRSFADSAEPVHNKCQELLTKILMWRKA